MENFHTFFKKYPNMDMELLNKFLEDYVEHINELGVGFVPIHDSFEADCCDDDPYDPYYGEYDQELDEEYNQAFGYDEPSPRDRAALEELLCAMEPYDEFDHIADVQYVVASTSYNMHETFYFMGNKDGAHGYSELSCSMAERWGHTFWNMTDAIDKALEEHLDKHNVKLIDTYRVEPDEFHSGLVTKRVYEVTKKQ